MQPFPLLSNYLVNTGQKLLSISAFIQSIKYNKRFIKPTGHLSQSSQKIASHWLLPSIHLGREERFQYLRNPFTLYGKLCNKRTYHFLMKLPLDVIEVEVEIYDCKGRIETAVVDNIFDDYGT